MSDPQDERRRLELFRSLHGLARTGLHFCRDVYDRERYEQIEQIAAELLAGGAGLTPGELRREWAHETGYVTPKIEVRGAVFRAADGKVLLVREASDGLWTLPGGWADINDTPSGAVRREIEQEAGFRTRVLKLAALYDRNAHGHTRSIFHSWKAFFICEVEGGAARGSYETDAVDFFDPHALPPMSLGRCTPQQVLRMRQHWLDPDLPTDFD
ncbi:MAG TPA: NUDIX hydrolase N-terminal domain-containing protein [Steroidobacteraceae bacterium]|nr:NUDIX hydrolase N-terminal domain-containing protein [Steroidobacteraceae bacterium]